MIINAYVKSHQTWGFPIKENSENKNKYIIIMVVNENIYIFFK